MLKSIKQLIKLTTNGPSIPALATVAPNHCPDLVSICSLRSLKLFPVEN